MNKILLSETISLSPNQAKRLKLVENAQSINGVPCIAAYKVPISKCDIENKNGRIYPRALWEKVIREKQGEDKPGLLDHPNGDSESVKDIFCSYKNLRIEGFTVYADAYLFGNNGRFVHEAIQTGDQVIGLSSVGYGNLSEQDGKTIDWQTYSLERPADAVINPSAGVFACAAGRIPSGQIESSGEMHSESAPSATFRTETSQLQERTERQYSRPTNPAVVEYLSEQTAAFPFLQEHTRGLRTVRNLQDVKRKVSRLKQEHFNS